MTFEEADKIIQVYGKFIEYTHSRLSLLFFCHPPKSMLPYSKEYLLEALEILSKHYKNINDKKRVKLFYEVAYILDDYWEDNEAIKKAVENWSNEKLKNTMIESIKKFHYDWAKLQATSELF